MFGRYSRKTQWNVSDLTLFFFSALTILVLPISIHCNLIQQQEHQHTSNYAVIVSTSRYYFNYRHSANALSIYNLLKKQGKFPDSHIILMLAHDYTCDARNPLKNAMYTEPNIYNNPEKNLAPHTSIEVDYRGDEVNVDTLRRVLLGRHEEGELPSRKLPELNSSSNIFIFLTGHGGDSFFKFQDMEEISTPDFQSIFQQMHILNRYNSILFVTDTCQAFTLSEGIEDIVPNVISIGSSLRDENSYAHHLDRNLGVSVIDRFTHQFMSFLTSTKNRKNWDRLSILQLVNSMTWRALRSNVGIRGDLDGRGMNSVKVWEFFEDISRKKKQNGIGISNKGRIMEWDEETDLVQELYTHPIKVDVCENCDIGSSEQNLREKVGTKDYDKKDVTLQNGMSQADLKLCVTTGLFIWAVRFSSKYW